MDDGALVLGNVELKDQALILSVNSQARAERGRALLNVFLITSTALFAYSLCGDLRYLGDPQPVYAQNGVTGLTWLVLAVVVWFVVVGLANLGGALVELCKLRKRRIG